jgi:hypothetical protein
MSVKITLTQQEILDRPNYYDLGEFVTQKMYEEIEFQNHRASDDKFIIVADDDGLVKGIYIPPVLDNVTEDGYDLCVICGKKSPYKIETHIDMRVGYVEGAGQGCFQSNVCGK